MKIEKTENEIKLQTHAQAAIAKAESLVVDNVDALSTANDVLKFIKDKIRQAETERTSIVKPFNDGVKAINARFKTITEPLEKASKELATKVLAFQSKLERERREEEEKKRKELEEFARKAQEEAAKNNNTETVQEIEKAIAIAVNKPVEIEKVRGSTGALSFIRKVWDFEVVDIQALAAARPDLVLPNAVAIRKELGEGVAIGGLKITQKEALSTR